MSEYIYEDGKKYTRRYKAENYTNVGRIVAVCLTSITMLALIIYGIYYSSLARKQEIILRSQYERALDDMLYHVDSARYYALKALASSTPEKTSDMLREVTRESENAQSCLSLLPIDSGMVSNVSGYLVQLGDIASCWSDRADNAGKLSNSEYDTLESLYGYAQDLYGMLLSMSSELTSETYTWNDIQNDSPKISEDNELSEKYSTLSSLSKPFDDYPSLIYDGPFSDHMSNISPKGLTGKDISPEDGAANVKSIMAKITSEKPSITFKAKYTNMNIEVYRYNVSFDDTMQADVDLTCKGGLLYSMMLYKDVGDTELSPDKAVEAGRSFLYAIGLKNMKSSYYTIEGPYITVNYSYFKDGILFYPDMVKVKISLDTGDIVGFEGNRYITYHHERDIPEGKLSIEECESRLSPNLSVISSNEVVFPNDYGGEAHAYEYRTSTMGYDFLVYVDCDTGRELELLVLLEESGSVLTV